VVITERKPRSWPLWLLALPAFVAVWSGWVGMGKLCGFGNVQPLPGIWDSLTLDTSITLPIGMEAYAAYAIKVWLSGEGSQAAVAFARRSTIAALTVGALGQVIYHLLTAAGVETAPWPITAAAATLPVGVLGMGATLAHLVQQPHHEDAAGAAGLPLTHTAVSGVARPPQKPAPRRTTTTPTRAASSGATRSARAATTTGRATGGADTAARVAALLTEDRYLTSAAIADRVGCSERTARRHRAAALQQLDHAEHADQAEHLDRRGVVVEDATTTAAVAPIRTTDPDHTDDESDSESEGDAA